MFLRIINTLCGVRTRVWRILNPLRDHFANRAWLKSQAGIEPATSPLWAGRSTTELQTPLQLRERDLNPQPFGPKPNNLPLIYPGCATNAHAGNCTLDHWLKRPLHYCCATRAPRLRRELNPQDPVLQTGPKPFWNSASVILKIIKIKL